MLFVIFLVSHVVTPAQTHCVAISDLEFLSPRFSLLSTAVAYHTVYT